MTFIFPVEISSTEQCHEGCKKNNIAFFTLLLYLCVSTSNQKHNKGIESSIDSNNFYILFQFSLKKNCQWAFKTQNHYKVPFSQLTYFLNLNCTLYGCGCRFTPGIIVLGSNFGKVSPVGLLIVQVCIKLTRNKKALFFPNNSPRQDRLPYPNGISLQRLEYNVYYYVIWK